MSDPGIKNRTDETEDARGRRPDRGAVVCALLLLLTLGQLVFASGLEQFQDKGFGARLGLYPAMMLAVPLIWRFTAKRQDDPPWAAFAWIMLPFLVDVTGNTLDLYDSVEWWDDANHYVNWMFLGLGAGLLLTRGARRPAWELVLLVAGIGAIMAIFWEVGEYYAFIRGGTELDTAYTDTLGDEVLGTLGALTAGVVTAVRASAMRLRP